MGANQSTAKKAPFWVFFEELKKAAGTYPPVWRCVGCHPAEDAAQFGRVDIVIDDDVATGANKQNTPALASREHVHTHANTYTHIFVFYTHRFLFYTHFFK